MYCYEMYKKKILLPLTRAILLKDVMMICSRNYESY